MYTCPMHPEIKQDKPGRCPKCGMNLVLESEVNTQSATTAKDAKKTSWKDYMPLIVIIGVIFLTSFTLSYRDFSFGNFQLTSFISFFMIGFFLTFSAFKLMDLPGFAAGYSTYDLLAKRWFTYGYIYPFIELLFGLSMILIESPLLLWFEFIVMVFSGLGVATKLAKKEKFQCACLGTFLKVPLTKVTLIEDFGMALLALTMIFLS